MTHEDAGKYSAKHPAGTPLDPVIAKAIKNAADNCRVTCAVAHGIAGDFRISPSEIGKTIDLLEYRIVKCQLGLFGYAPEKKIVRPADVISEELRNYLEQSMIDGENRKISCAACWVGARTLGIGKMAVSEACERLDIKIGPCQLGAF